MIRYHIIEYTLRKLRQDTIEVGKVDKVDKGNLIDMTDKVDKVDKIYDTSDRYARNDTEATHDK